MDTHKQAISVLCVHAENTSIWDTAATLWLYLYAELHPYPLPLVHYSRSQYLNIVMSENYRKHTLTAEVVAVTCHMYNGTHWVLKHTSIGMTCVSTVS